MAMEFDHTQNFLIGIQIVLWIRRWFHAMSDITDRVGEASYMANDPASGSINVSYIKSASFKNIHADGCFGGLSPKGYIHMAVYSERSALPKSSTIDIINGQPGAEHITDTRGGVVRELEADLIFDLQTALSISAWLRAKSNEARVALGMPDEAWDQMIQAVGAQ